MKPAALLFALVSLFGVILLADETHHHEDLTAEQLGTVHFPVSCASAVQKPFERGVALLHSFWYEEAEKQFAKVAQDDPRCAMAYWGEAMSLYHQIWNRPSEADVKHGAELVAKAKQVGVRTQRERDYIAAMEAFYGDPAKF